jgi:hypothetical protein
MDADFKVVSFRLHNLSVCKAKALLKLKTFDLTEIQSRVKQLTHWWRVRTYDFMRFKVFEHNPLRVQYLRNCLPSVGLLEKSSLQFRKCLSYACPWCWNRRYCEIPYKVISKYVKENKTAVCQYYVKTIDYPKSKYAKASKLFKEQSEQAIVLCRKLTRRKSVDGGMCHTYLEPAAEGFKVITKLIVSSQSLLNLDDSFVFQFSSTSARKLCSYFGYYPFSLLRRNFGSKGFCLFLKNMPKGNRKFLRFGKFYGKDKHAQR